MRPASWTPVWAGALAGAALAMLFTPGAFLLGALAGAMVGAAWRAARGGGSSDGPDRDRRWRDLEARVESLEREIAVLRAIRAGVAPVPVPHSAAGPPAVGSPATGADGGSAALASAAAPSVQPAWPLPPVAAPTLERSPALPATVEPRLGAAFALPEDEARPRAPAAIASVPSQAGQLLADVRAWLLGGNTVARVGLLILFVGVAFLLRYVAEHTRVPIEVRLLGVSAGALAFLFLGWRLRHQRAGFALTLQGGAIGMLYLTAFAALRLYGVLGAGAAFAFMAALAVFSGLLAILQDGRALAALGALGGFAAPLLISTGAGRIELLFGFYLLLNAGVLGVAWFRAWRELNWIAFSFTFGVSGLWAVQRYSPGDFVVGQGFLAAFWLLFLAVALLHALRQSGTRRGRFDTTLVFALPLAAFGIQTRFTHGVPLACASLVGAAVYLAISGALLRRREPALRLLVEANFGLGVTLLTLAVPLAASAQWTAAAWALEGVATAWVGLRQRRALPLAAGLALQVLAPLSLARAVVAGQVDLSPHWSGMTINLALLAVCAMLAARLLASGREPDWTHPAGLPRVALAWLMRAAAWGWAAAALWQPLAYPAYVYAWCALALGLVAFDRRGSQGAGDAAAADADADADVLTPEWVASVALAIAATGAALAALPAQSGHDLGEAVVPRLAAAATALAIALLSVGGDGRRRTAAAGLLSLAVFAWMFAVLADAVAREEPALAVAQLALVLAALIALGLGWLAGRLKWHWPQYLAWTFHPAVLVFGASVVADALMRSNAPSARNGAVAWLLGWGVYYLRFVQASRMEPVLQRPAVEALHVAGLWLLPAMVAAEGSTRLGRFAGEGWVDASWGVVAAGALWFASIRPARWPATAAPDAYRRIGATGLAAFAVLWLASAGLGQGGDPAPLPAWPVLNPMDLASLLLLASLALWRRISDAPRVADRVLAGCAFLVANLLLLRALHFTAGVGWSVAQWNASLVVQACLSILWTLAAMAAMLAANRLSMRPLWMAGAALLGVVIAKLFLVDLSGQGTVERIVSFVAVGLLIMLIGYLTPVPPARTAAQAASAEPAP